MTNPTPQPGGATSQVETAKPVLYAYGAWLLSGVLTVFGWQLTLGFFLYIPSGLLLILGIVVATIVGSLVGIKSVRAAGIVSASNAHQTPPAIAYTPQGEPVYQVVGYTAAGKPITADQAVGYQSGIGRTNTLAIVTLIVSLVLAVLAIPLGHISLVQIERTGESGRGLAIAGLVIGYIWLIGLVIFGLVATLSYL